MRKYDKHHLIIKKNKNLKAENKDEFASRHVQLYYNKLVDNPVYVNKIAILRSKIELVFSHKFW